MRPETGSICANRYAQWATYTGDNAIFYGNGPVWPVRRATGIEILSEEYLGGAGPLTPRRP
jgi:hypothetical protein